MIKKFNPGAPVFWIVTAAVGYLIGADFYSAVVGFVIGVGISVAVTIVAD